MDNSCTSIGEEMFAARAFTDSSSLSPSLREVFAVPQHIMGGAKCEKTWAILHAIATREQELRDVTFFCEQLVEMMLHVTCNAM